MVLLLLESSFSFFVMCLDLYDSVLYAPEGNKNTLVLELSSACIMTYRSLLLSFSSGASAFLFGIFLGVRNSVGILGLRSL